MPSSLCLHHLGLTCSSVYRLSRAGPGAGHQGHSLLESHEYRAGPESGFPKTVRAYEVGDSACTERIVSAEDTPVLGSELVG